MSHELWHEVERFLAMETRLLDEQKFEDWLDLFTDDAVYRMPVRMNPWRSSSPEDGVTKPGEMALVRGDQGDAHCQGRQAAHGRGLAGSAGVPGRVT